MRYCSWQLDGVSLIPDCIGTIIDEKNEEPKGLIKITDVLGRVIKATNNHSLFYIYNDGTVEKRIIID